MSWPLNHHLLVSEVIKISITVAVLIFGLFEWFLLLDESDQDGQLAEYRRQLAYYKNELEKAMNGGGGGSMESKIEINELRRNLEAKSIKLDELQIQVFTTVVHLTLILGRKCKWRTRRYNKRTNQGVKTKFGAIKAKQVWG